MVARKSVNSQKILSQERRWEEQSWEEVKTDLENPLCCEHTSLAAVLASSPSRSEPSPSYWAKIPETLRFVTSRYPCGTSALPPQCSESSESAPKLKLHLQSSSVFHSLALRTNQQRQQQQKSLYIWVMIPSDILASVCKLF